MYSKLLLDHAGEWYRAAKSIQEDQIYVKDQIYSNRSQTDRVQEQSTSLTLDTHPQASFDSKSEDREKIAGSSASLEIPKEHEGDTPYTPGSQKSTRKNFGKPASSFSDFYM